MNSVTWLNTGITVREIINKAVLKFMHHVQMQSPGPCAHVLKMPDFLVPLTVLSIQKPELSRHNIAIIQHLEYP